MNILSDHMGGNHLVSQEDLALFKEELIEQVKQILLEHGKGLHTKRWIKTYQLKEMLPISDGTLQKLRNNGTLKCSIVDGLALYDLDDVLAFMQTAKTAHRKNRKHGVVIP